MMIFLRKFEKYVLKKEIIHLFGMEFLTSTTSFSSFKYNECIFAHEYSMVSACRTYQSV